MNDADFEMLARSAAAGLIERGVKPYTLPDETWLRMRAIELMIDTVLTANIKIADNDAMTLAKGYLEFMKGESK